jgi:hypothetical protein
MAIIVLLAMIFAVGFRTRVAAIILCVLGLALWFGLG